MYVKYDENGNYGFYSTEFHGEEITEDPTYIPITDTAYNKLINGAGRYLLGDIGEAEEITEAHIIDFIPPPPTIEDLNRRSLEEVLLQLQSDMRVWVDIPNSELTDADIKRGIKLAMRSQIKLIRLVLNKLEGED